MNEQMIRVTRSNPCPVCGKPDWCLVRKDRKKAICCRHESPHFVERAEGWLHILEDDGSWQQQPTVIRGRRPFRVRPRPDFDATAEHQRYLKGISQGTRLVDLATDLGLMRVTLTLLEAGWSGVHQAYTFPMRNDQGDVIGIRLRTTTAKFAVRGSRAGLFFDRASLNCLDDHEPLLICEGPTDHAALTEMGYIAVGRPSCRGGVDYLLWLTQRLKCDVCIVADADGPGRDGAHYLADELVKSGRAVKVIEPGGGHKDVRAWYLAGAGYDAVQCKIEHAYWWRAQ